MGKGEVMTQAGAWATYDRWLEDDRILFLGEPSVPQEIDRAFRRMSRLRRPARKDWADSYLVAFALVSDLTLVTFDRALHDKAQRAILLK